MGEVSLEGVEITGDSEKCNFMVENFLDNGLGYIKSQNGQHVQVYKTEEASGQDLGGALELFGMCKVAAPVPRLESPIPRIPDNSKVRSLSDQNIIKSV